MPKDCFAKKIYFEYVFKFLSVYMKQLLLILVVIVFSGIESRAQKSSYAKQSPNEYDTDLLPPIFYQQNRERLLASLPEGSVAIFFANEEKTRNNDITYLYRQSNSIYYLTGHLESESILVISKIPMLIDGKSVSEILFVQPRDPRAETWTGRRLGTENAIQKMGLAHALTTDKFSQVFKESLLADIRPKLSGIYLSLPSQGWEDSDGDISKTIKSVRAAADSLKITIQSASPILGQMRQLKHPLEIEMIQKATDISIEAHLQAIMSCEPGMYEYELAAVGEYVFKRQGCEYTAYPSIVGAGENSVILHYQTTRKKIMFGELVLMDMGGEYHGYATDITRTVPANGKFSVEQLAIYNLVLAAQDSAIAACLTGNSFVAPHRKATEVISNGLFKLGIIKEFKEARTYFMHGTSHSVGLDVHDPNMAVLQAGQIFTVEPGIYIAENSPCDPKWWNIGVRLEDMVLITSGGYEVMSRALTRRPEEIEALMKKKGIGNTAIK
jgi:Xaa-Pro aminopeptidase